MKHYSDCSTNNHGVPELLGPCDCGGYDEIATLISHETEPHCCGCWIIHYGRDGGLSAYCNECRKSVDIVELLRYLPEDDYVCPIHGKIAGGSECPRC